MEMVCGMKKIIPASGNCMWETETVVQTTGTKVLEPLGKVGEAMWNKSFGTVGAKVLAPLARVWEALWNKSFGTISN